MIEALVDRRDGLWRCLLLCRGQPRDLVVDAIAAPSQLGTVKTLASAPRRQGEAYHAACQDGESVYLRAKDRSLGAGDAVQITADAHAGKSATASSEISRGGRFLVHLPGAQGIRRSRRQPHDLEPETAAALTGLPGGWILRSAAATADPDWILAEARALCAPPPLAPALHSFLAMLPIGASIAIDASASGAPVAAWVRAAMPDCHLATPPAGLADRIDETLAIATARRVAIADAPPLTIEPTAAMTVIDIDGGGLVPLAANLAAMPVIAQHLRLRQLGGLIVADSITLRRRSEREQVVQRLRTALAEDPIPSHCHGMTSMGLIEITRERRLRPLTETLRLAVDS